VGGFEEISFLQSIETFREMSDRLWSNFELMTRPKAERLENLTVDVPLSLRQAFAGDRYAFRCRLERFVRRAVVQGVSDLTHAGTVKGTEH
jgi:hypothetical protein